MSDILENDSTRDIAIRCVDRLVKDGYIKDCVDTNDETENSVQDIIQEEIYKALSKVPLTYNIISEDNRKEK